MTPERQAEMFGPLNDLMPALLRLVPPHVSEAEVKFTVTTKDSPLVYGVSSHVRLNRMMGHDSTETDLYVALASAVAMLLPESEHGKQCDFDLSALVYEGADVVDYGVAGSFGGPSKGGSQLALDERGRIVVRHSQRKQAKKKRP